MKRLSWLAAVALLITLTVPMRASAPPIQGAASGIELCEQAVCGSAIFIAIFTGQAGNNPRTLGTIIVSVTHDPLPPANVTANLRTGVWVLQPLLGRPISGIVTGGTIHNNDDDGTFDIVANMHLTNGGSGDVTFAGVLSHNAFPPTLIGHIQ